MTDELDRKIFGAIGHYKKHHMSNIQVPNSPIIFTEPGRRGFFNINMLQPGKTYEVFCDSRCVGRMNYDTIMKKFGR